MSLIPLAVTETNYKLPKNMEKNEKNNFWAQSDLLSAAVLAVVGLFCPEGRLSPWQATSAMCRRSCPIPSADGRTVGRRSDCRPLRFRFDVVIQISSIRAFVSYHRMILVRSTRVSIIRENWRSPTAAQRSVLSLIETILDISWYEISSLIQRFWSFKSFNSASF